MLRRCKRTKVRVPIYPNMRALTSLPVPRAKPLAALSERQSNEKPEHFRHFESLAIGPTLRYIAPGVLANNMIRLTFSVSPIQ